MKRLKVISDFTDLGSGFKVALKDMEVRGAGNLLGAEQSGGILAVGYDMYVRLLDDAIATVRGEEEAEIPDVYLELEYAGFIPDDYVSEPMEKTEIYKKVAAVGDENELARLHAETEDRFGPAPDTVPSLLAIAEIRVACRRLAISSLKERRGVVTIEFPHRPRLRGAGGAPDRRERRRGDAGQGPPELPAAENRRHRPAREIGVHQREAERPRLILGRLLCSEPMPTRVSAAADLKRELLTAEDFLEWLEPGRTADLIDGELFMHSPVSIRHAELLKSAASIDPT